MANCVTCRALCRWAGQHYVANCIGYVPKEYPESMRCKEDCYWYREWQDMNANIPYCKCKNVDFIEPKDCSNCEQYHSKSKPTKADSIRAMSDEQLAEFLKNIRFKNGGCPTDMSKCKNNSCYDCWLDWLRQEAGKEKA